ncbi:MAG: mono/diheme cytochrome c family protein [Alphaproteobacteria bacterium]|jgi:mono/diheme cytochrome c family protein
MISFSIVSKSRWHALTRAAAVFTVFAGLAVMTPFPASAQQVPSDHSGDKIRIPLQGLPDLVFPNMSPARGRVYFATRACVVCHSVNNVGGNLAASFDYDTNDKTIDVMSFVTRMWRGAQPMIALQNTLFGEPLDLAPDELADIIAFLHSAEEKNKFSEKDLPKFIRDFMAARLGAGSK